MCATFWKAEGKFYDNNKKLASYVYNAYFTALLGVVITN